ncbi:MAG: 4-hydroxy-tetrahydrodipicolinate reductase [Proteobacteria bacterium]|nr:4-hydroxy-tetrahydrodipicolinate reductase [Pseudomonadota bacterium]
MSDLIRLAVLGAGGRMGRAVMSLVLDDSRFELVAAHSRSGSEYVGSDAAVLAARPPCGIEVQDDIGSVLEAADVAIEFTRPEFTVEIARRCADAGCALVSGTTGMNPDQRGELEGFSAKVPIFWAPNMSIGVNLLLAALEHVAANLDEGYDAEIVEAHHRHKVDAPSGTAIALGEVLAKAKGGSLESLAENGRHGRPGPRESGKIGFHAIRGGEIVGEHDVRLISAGEEIRLGHTAFNRGAFAAGALRAARWLHGREPGFHGMRDLLKNA